MNRKLLISRKRKEKDIARLVSSGFTIERSLEDNN